MSHKINFAILRIFLEINFAISKKFNAGRCQISSVLENQYKMFVADTGLFVTLAFGDKGYETNYCLLKSNLPDTKHINH